MIPVSSAFLARMRERTDFHLSAVVTLANSTIILLDDDDFVMSGNRITDSAGGGALPIGAAICRTAELELVNFDGRWDNVSFVGAEIELSLQYDTSATATPDIETVLLGTFTVRQPATYGTTVVLVGSDDMARAETLYETALTFPQTAFEVWGEICTTLGISSDYASASALPGGTFEIATAPSSDLTYRQVLGYIAMLSGGNARVSRARKLEVVNYDFASLATARSGGTIPASMHELELWKELTSDREDVTVTGVSTVVSQENGGFDIISAGTDGNVLNIVNPLIAGHEQAAVTGIWTALSGAQYRPFSGSHVGYPIAEFGDIAYINDGLGREFYTVITDMVYTVNSFAELAASGETSESSGSVSMGQKLNVLTADVADIKRLKVGWAEIETAIIDTLEANGINADWIDTGSITITYKDEHDEEWNILSADVSDKTLVVGPWNVSRYGDFKMTYTHSSVSETTNFGGGLSAHYAANGLPGVGYSTEKYGETYKRGITNYGFMYTGPNTSPSPWRNYFKPDVDNQVGLDIYFTDTIGNNSGVELNEDGIWVASTGGIYVWNNSHAKYIDVAEKIAEVDSTVMRVGAAGTWADSTVQLPTTPTGTGATQNVVFSLPTGATLVGVTLTATSSAVALVSNRILSNTAAQIRAYSLATGTTFTWADVTARPIYTL